MSENEKFFKICLLGDWGVGKSNLILRFVDDTFNPEHESTLGVDFKVKVIEVDNTPVKLKICDTAGQERFRTITSSFYRGSQGIIMLYDCSDKDTFNNLVQWMDEVKRYAPENVTAIIVGNKCDKTDKVVDSTTGKEFASSHNYLFFETSAKTGENVAKCMEEIARAIMARSSASQTSGGVEPKIAPKKKGGCSI